MFSFIYLNILAPLKCETDPFRALATLVVVYSPQDGVMFGVSSQPSCKKRRQMPFVPQNKNVVI